MTNTNHVEYSCSPQRCRCCCRLISLRNGPVMPRVERPRTARAAAPDDLTGYWVSVVTEKWRYRMLVPDKGDYVKVPLNPEGRKVADAWDPAKDQSER